MQQLIKQIQIGWPDTKTKLPNDLKQYFGYRDELTVHSNVVFKGQQLLIPQSIR